MTKEKKTTGFMTGLAKTISTTSKQLVWVYTINGIAWIWCSYALAFMGRDQIAESLSSNVCSVVIGQIGFYLISKTIENVFKFNDFKFTRCKNVDDCVSDTSEPDFTEPTVDIPQPPEYEDLNNMIFNEGDVNNGEQSDECSVDSSSLL